MMGHMQKLKVIYDTDPGVDDAMALLLLARHKRIELIGVTSVFGNADIATTTRNALYLKQKLGFSAPVARGAGAPLVGEPDDPPTFVHGHNGLGDIALPDITETVDPRPAHQLIIDLVRGAKVTESGDTLLASGALIWMGNALVFGLLYWLLDSGGPLARYRHERPQPDFAFSQQLNPELAPPGWRPRYVDYLILGLTTSMAFSPTDVMPMRPWAKLTMALQSLISLTVIGLVIARAINVFS